MSKCLLIFVLLYLAPCVRGQPLDPDPRAISVYRFSVAALIAASAADAATSWGRPEANPVLGNRFEGRALATKSLLVGVPMLAQWLVARHHPGRRRYFAYLNFGVSAATGLVAFRNSRLPR